MHCDSRRPHRKALGRVRRTHRRGIASILHFGAFAAIAPADPGMDGHRPDYCTSGQHAHGDGDTNGGRKEGAVSALHAVLSAAARHRRGLQPSCAWLVCRRVVRRCARMPPTALACSHGHEQWQALADTGWRWHWHWHWHWQQLDACHRCPLKQQSLVTRSSDTQRQPGFGAAPPFWGLWQPRSGATPGGDHSPFKAKDSASRMSGSCLLLAASDSGVESVRHQPLWNAKSPVPRGAERFC